MSRGLGRQQRTILAALRLLDEERGPDWRSPAEVIATLELGTRAEVERFDPDERTDGPRLEHLRRLVAQGYREFQATVREIEERMAGREAGRAAARRKAARRAPNQIRQTPRAGESGNPSRVLALLERRGLIERQAHCGPGSAVRLAVG